MVTETLLEELLAGAPLIEQNSNPSPPAEASTSEAAADSGPAFTGWCIFTITAEDLNPDHINLLLNMDADRAVQGLPGRPGLWQLNSSLTAQARLDEHLDQLLRRLLPVRNQLRRIAHDARLEFFCAIEKRTSAMIEFHLPPQLLLLIGYVGAHVVCEISDVAKTTS
ncbi:MAG: DUF4279 domain-containing protein [Leptospirales bacterium]|nr:DUF4279 domain-containing protein [Leptospirales bacterium]